MTTSALCGISLDQWVSNGSVSGTFTLLKGTSGNLTSACKEFPGAESANRSMAWCGAVPSPMPSTSEELGWERNEEGEQGRWERLTSKLGMRQRAALYGVLMES